MLNSRMKLKDIKNACYGQRYKVGQISYLDIIHDTNIDTHQIHPTSSDHPLIVGFGACLDAIVNQSDFFAAAGVYMSSFFI